MNLKLITLTNQSDWSFETHFNTVAHDNTGFWGRNNGVAWIIEDLSIQSHDEKPRLSRYSIIMHLFRPANEMRAGLTCMKISATCLQITATFKNEARLGLFNQLTSHFSIKRIWKKTNCSCETIKALAAKLYIQ